MHFFNTEVTEVSRRVLYGKAVYYMFNLPCLKMATRSIRRKGVGGGNEFRWYINYSGYGPFTRRLMPSFNLTTLKLISNPTLKFPSFI